MARFKGTFEVPANYEPQKAAPFDARSLVNTKASLTQASTWQDSKGDMWIYSGMLVTVSADSENNNGVYRLLDAEHYNNESYWQKLVELPELVQVKDDLQTQLDNIVISGGDIALKEQVDTIAAQVNALDAIVNDELAGIIAAHSRLDTVEQENELMSEKILFHSNILEGIGGEGQPATVLQAIEAITFELPVASMETLGGVKLSEVIGLNDAGQIEVKKLSTDKLIQGDKELVLNGGTAD